MAGTRDGGIGTDVGGAGGAAGDVGAGGEGGVDAAADGDASDTSVTDGPPADAGSTGDAPDAPMDAPGVGDGPGVGSEAGAPAPVILSFSASPASPPAGGGPSTLTWQVEGATTVSIDQGLGVQGLGVQGVVSGSKAVTVAGPTIFTLTASNGGGTATATTAVVPGQNPFIMGDRWVYIGSPTTGETFSAPATLRLIAAAHDPFIDTNSPTQGLGGNAQKVQFFVDDAPVLEVDGAHAEYWIFKGFVSGIAAGTHRVWARATYTNPALVLDSAPIVVTVAAPPTYDRTVELTADVTLTGTQGYELTGSPGKRIRLNGNGHRIVSTTAAGPLTLRFVDVFDLGSRADTSEPSIQVTTSGAVTVEDSVFDTSNTLELTAEGAAPVSLQRNLFRSNMRMPIGQSPSSAGSGPSYPSVRLSGLSTGAKVFAGNNTGAGWVQFEKTTKWRIGGDTDADSNVLIGPRVGLYVQDTTDSQVRRNFSHHAYFGGWSQGSNFELGGSPTLVVEHNVIYSSSWPVRGAGCEFRYNLVADAGHEFIWPEMGASIHHNVFEGGFSDIASIYLINKFTDVKVFNNTVDGQLYRDMVTAVELTAATTMSLSSNAFVNVPQPLGAAAGATVTISGGTLTADYNAFANVQTNDYSDGRHPTHDVHLDAANGAQVLFTNPPTTAFDLDEGPIWRRTTTVRDVLTRYRLRYTPKAGSPVIDRGDPAGGAGNDIGAVGSGTPNAADRFGVF